MKDFQDRVVVEKQELDEKISKLDVFVHGSIYGSLPECERLRLMRQLCHMRDYSNVLGERIDNFQ